MNKGRIVIVSGPSGAGKSSALKTVLENHPDFFFSVSATTRGPRPGEQAGVSYHYITTQEFQALIDANDLLEYNHYASGDYYGTPATPILQTLERDGTAILDVEPNGAFQVQEKYPDARMIFLVPPSLAELRRRLEDRKDTPPEKIKARLNQARWEIAQACRYEYLVLNDQLDRCVAELEAILAGSPEAQAYRYENRTDLNILKEVL